MIVFHVVAKFCLSDQLRHIAAIVFLVASVFLPASILPAAEYPAKTIQVINPFPPGAVTDIVARILLPKMSASLGQQLVIINKTGGGGAVGIQAAKEAAPDGYTILVTPPPILIIPIVNKNSSYTTRDFIPIALATSSPNTTVVKAEAPWKTLEEFIADAKKKPGELTYGSAGPGTTPHFIAELVKLKTQIDLTHVPLGSESAAATAVLGGHVNISFLTLGTTRSHIEAGTMRALAVASNRRLKDFPNVPTTVEKGFPELNLKVWVGFFAPAKTPDAVVQKLNAEINAAINEPDSLEKLAKSGFDPVVKDVAGANAYFNSEIESWGKMVKAIGFSN